MALARGGRSDWVAIDQTEVEITLRIIEEEGGRKKLVQTARSPTKTDVSLGVRQAPEPTHHTVAGNSGYDPLEVTVMMMLVASGRT